MCRTARPGWPVREVPLPPRVIARSLTPSQERFNDFDVVRTDRRPSSFHSSDCHSRSIPARDRSEEHTSELQSHSDLVCRLLLEKKKKKKNTNNKKKQKKKETSKKQKPKHETNIHNST